MLALFGLRFGDYCDHYGYVQMGYGGDPPTCEKCGKALDDLDIERLKEEMSEHIRAASKPSECSKDALR